MRKGKWHLGWEIEFSYQDLQEMGRCLGFSQKEVLGYQYWRSWKEPVFVLKDLYDKFHRRNPLRQNEPFNSIKQLYDAVWNKIENKWGHYFMQNIVIVYKKSK